MKYIVICWLVCWACYCNLWHSTTRGNSLTVKERKAGVSVADSITFELVASLAHEIDLPEEYPSNGDTLCAYVARDTIFVEYWHDQRKKFRYVHGD